MKSDEILADLLTKWDHCPMEDVLHIGDSYPCDNVPQPKSCKHCLLDWARKKEKESGILCVKCGKPVEHERECYYHPTCYACLPPPTPLEIIQATEPVAEESERNPIK